MTLDEAANAAADREREPWYWKLHQAEQEAYVRAFRQGAHWMQTQETQEVRRAVTGSDSSENPRTAASDVPSVEELIFHLHINTPAHGADVCSCDLWPCSLIGVPHRFATDDDPARRWNNPGECYLCCEAEAHSNHQPAAGSTAATDQG